MFSAVLRDGAKKPRVKSESRGVTANTLLERVDIRIIRCEPKVICKTQSQSEITVNEYYPSIGGECGEKGAVLGKWGERGGRFFEC